MLNEIEQLVSSDGRIPPRAVITDTQGPPRGRMERYSLRLERCMLRGPATLTAEQVGGICLWILLLGLNRLGVDCEIAEGLSACPKPQRRVDLTTRFVKHRRFMTDHEPSGFIGPEPASSSLCGAAAARQYTLSQSHEQRTNDTVQSQLENSTLQTRGKQV